MDEEMSPQKKAWETRKKLYGPSGSGKKLSEQVKEVVKDRGADLTIRYPLPPVTCPTCGRLVTLRFRCIEVKGKRRRKHKVEVQ